MQESDVTKWVAPCVIEDPKILGEIPVETPIMLYGGQSMKWSSQFDSIREICKNRKGKVGIAQGDPMSVIIGELAGVNFYETNFALDLAA